jgi:hypothetical protein
MAGGVRVEGHLTVGNGGMSYEEFVEVLCFIGEKGGRFRPYF